MKAKNIFIILILILFLIIPSGYVQAKDSKENLNIYSEAAILIDSNTGVVLYEKNSKQKMYPASTTKILTAIIALEKCNLDEKVTVSKSAISAIPPGYSSCYLSEGEEISVNDLLTVFLVHSANDAGYVLAEYISGSIDNFAELMNQKANELGCENSHFVNPSGIHNNNHYSSAYDMSLIAKYCMKNKTFRSIVSKRNCVISPTNKFDTRQYVNTNDLLNPSSKYYLENCIGIKTGYTSEAKNCLISCCTQNNLELISVVLGGAYTETGDSVRYVDSRTLFEYGYSNYSLKTIAKKGDIMTSLEVANGTKDTKNLDLSLENDIKALVKNSETNPEYDISLNETISAPISQNNCVGTISYNINGITYTENLLASHDVEQNNSLILILEISLGLLIILIAITIISLKFKNTKKKSKHYYNY